MSSYWLEYMSGVNADGDVEKQSLFGEFEIRMAKAACPICCLDRSVGEVRLLLADGECQVETIRGPQNCECEDDSREVRANRGEVTELCHCVVFQEHGCIPKVKQIDGDRAVIETHLPDKSLLSDLVESLKRATEGVTLRRLKRLEADGDNSASDTVMLDITDITEKQREAVMVAVSKGYYSKPREATLEELADTLGVTKAAVTQRLNAVESKLALRAFSEATTQR